MNTDPKPEFKPHMTLVLMDRSMEIAEPIVQDVRSSMKQAVDELATGMDRAKPLIRGGVESVRGAADEIKEQATETWKQMRKPKSGTLLDPRQLPAQLTVAVA